MRVHRFKDTASARAAAQTVNDAEGYPRKSCETQAYCVAEEVMGIVFIMADEVTERYLGESEDVDFSEQKP